MKILLNKLIKFSNKFISNFIIYDINQLTGCNSCLRVIKNVQEFYKFYKNKETLYKNKGTLYKNKGTL